MKRVGRVSIHFLPGLKLGVCERIVRRDCLLVYRPGIFPFFLFFLSFLSFLSFFQNFDTYFSASSTILSFFLHLFFPTVFFPLVLPFIPTFSLSLSLLSTLRSIFFSSGSHVWKQTQKRRRRDSIVVHAFLSIISHDIEPNEHVMRVREEKNGGRNF